MADFEAFPKISRLSRSMVVTEKIDGTNAQVSVEFCPRSNGAGERTDDGEGLCVYSEKVKEWFVLRAGSRTRWITPEKDNYGFAAWVFDHAQELVDGLGEGRHFGEWWGQGIQRGYGLLEKRFSLFNVSRWRDARSPHWPTAFLAATPEAVLAPACCSVVPVVGYFDRFDTEFIDEILSDMRRVGSAAAPSYMKPEGVVVFHRASGVMFKKTLEKDDRPKGSQEAP